MRLEMRERRVCRTCGVLGSSLSLLREGKATLWEPAQALHPQGVQSASGPHPFHATSLQPRIVKKQTLNFQSDGRQCGQGRRGQSTFILVSFANSCVAHFVVNLAAPGSASDGSRGFGFFFEPLQLLES